MEFMTSASTWSLHQAENDSASVIPETSRDIDGGRVVRLTIISNAYVYWFII